MSQPAPPSPVDAAYVAPSADRPLNVGEKISSLFEANLTNEFTLQRLTDRTYWVQRYFYGTTFHVGDEGVLLFDPLESRGEALLAAVKSVTDKPVTALVYSHAHADHIADAAPMMQALGDGVEVIASTETAAKLEYLGSTLPRPTREVDWPTGSFRFEDETISLHGFTRAAHCDDHAAWLLETDRVLHAPDLLNPDQPPFWKLAGSENAIYLPGNLEQADALEWDWLNGGHGNVGSHDDVQFHLQALADYTAAAIQAMEANPFGNFIDPSTTNAHTTFMNSFMAAVVRDATEILRPKYGEFYGFDAGIESTLVLVAHAAMSYR